MITINSNKKFFSLTSSCRNSKTIREDYFRSYSTCGRFTSYLHWIYHIAIIMAQPAQQEDMDYLNLSENENIKTLIENEGLGAQETIIYSEKVTKINRKGKKQDRYLMITNKAIYNIKPKKYAKSKRRVAISDVGMLTLSAISPEFAIHIPLNMIIIYAQSQRIKYVKYYRIYIIRKQWVIPNCWLFILN